MAGVSRGAGLGRFAFEDPQVERRFMAMPEPARGQLLALRDLIFEVAGTTPGVGRIQETLKWGQPAYLTPETKSGSTIRLGQPKGGGVAIYTHCQTTIMSDFQALFAGEFDFEGNRAVLLAAEGPVKADKLRLLIAAALTYHLR